MEIKEGYRNTDIGIIPTEWKLSSIDGVSVPKGLVRGPFGGALKKEYFIPKGIKIYEQKNAIYKDVNLGSYYIDNSKFIELARFEVQEGDFIVSCSGTIGRIFQIPRNFEKGIINQALLKITTDDNIIYKPFFFYYFEWEKFQEKIIDNTQGGAMKNLVGMSVFKNTIIPLPPLLEQQSIAEVLIDTNKLIQSLEKTIAKKCNIKQGVMQKLLKPKDGWEVKKLGDIFEISGGLSASREQLSDEGFCYLHYGDIHGSLKTYVDCADDFSNIPKLQIELNKVSKKSFLKNGDIVFVDASEDDDGVSRHIIIRNEKNIPFISGSHTIVAKSKDESLNNKYKSYCFQCKYMKDQFRFYAVGTKVSGVSKTSIKNIYIHIPPFDEQIRIATILDDLDSEIEVVEKKLSKYKLLKQGLMQNLLTGKIRLKQT
jgi:type I restriction enzyme S subunit